MAFTPISTGQVDANSPLDTTLMDLIRTNEDDLDARLSGQTVYVQTSASTALSATAFTITPSSLVPQIGQGLTVLSAVITPNSSSDKLIIRANVYGSAGSISLFQNSNSSAIYAVGLSVGNNPFEYIIDPIGTTAASTFSIMLGSSSTGNPIRFNGITSTTVPFGGKVHSNMTITEIATT